MDAKLGLRARMFQFPGLRRGQYSGRKSTESLETLTSLDTTTGGLMEQNSTKASRRILECHR